MEQPLNKSRSTSSYTPQTHFNYSKEQEIMAFGQTTITKFHKSNIFVQGLRGLGAEICKNIIMLEPLRLVIFDKGIVEACDLGASFLLKEEHIQKLSRAHASKETLCKLTPEGSCTQIEVYQQEQVEFDFLVKNNIELVIFTNYYVISELIQLNKLCRNALPNPIKFMYCGCLGLHSFCFIDFGPDFKVYDKDGESQESFIIQSISKSNPGVVTINKAKKHNYQSGDFVRIFDLDNMPELSGGDARPIRVLNDFQFTIEDTSEFSDYVRGGLVELAKVPFKIKFRSLEESLNVINTDNFFMKSVYQNEAELEMGKQLHLSLLGLFEFSRSHNNTLPVTNNEAHHAEFQDLLMQINQQNMQAQRFHVTMLNKTIARNVVKFCRCNIAPVCSWFGSIIALEAIKSTGKFLPILDFYHVQQFKCLQQDEAKHPVNRQLPKEDSRYNDYIAIFGNGMQESVAKLKIMLIGAGSNGCEYVKDLALMGAGTASQQSAGIYIIDDSLRNQIKLKLKSGVLFQGSQFKSEIVSSYAKYVNSSVTANAITVKCPASSQHQIFDDIWQQSNLVIGAVDQEDSRESINQQIIWHEKPFLDSSIHALCVECNVIVPFCTEPLSKETIFKYEQQKLGMQKINADFPFNNVHTIIWAKQKFDSFFSEIIKVIQKFTENPQVFIQTQLKTMQSNENQRMRYRFLPKILQKGDTATKIKHFIQIAIKLFEYLYIYKIERLVKLHPYNSLDNDKEFFWSGYRKFPNPKELDSSDETIIDFLLSVVQLFAFITNANFDDEVPRETILSMIKTKVNQHKKKHQSREELIDLQSTFTQEECQKFILKMQQIYKVHHKLCLDFISAASNMQARCYNIHEIQQYKVNKLAFQIQRNIELTHSYATGLNSLEIYKILQSSTSNLACNKFQRLPPPAVIKHKIYPNKDNSETFTIWDKIAFQHSQTCKEIIDKLQNQYQIEIKSFKIENSLDINAADINDQIDPYTLYEQTTGIQLRNIKQQIEMFVNAQDSEGNICHLPKIKYLNTEHKL